MLRLNYEMIMAIEPCYNPVDTGLIDDTWEGTMQDVLLETELPPYDAVWLAVNDEFLPTEALNELEQIVFSSIGEYHKQVFVDAMTMLYPNGDYKLRWVYGWNVCLVFVWSHSGSYCDFAGYCYDRYDKTQNIQWQILRGILLYLYTKYT